MIKAPSLERVKALVSYDPETGAFTNKIRRGGLNVGDKAGVENTKGYIVLTLDGCKIYAQRLAVFYVTGSWPKRLVDHENRNKGDNRWGNLREATDQQNQVNSKSEAGQLLRGVSKVSTKPGWFMAQIVLDYKKLYLGIFPNQEEAHEAYKKKHLEIHGEFSCYYRKEKA